MSTISARNGFMPYPELPLENLPSGPLQGLRFAVKDVFHIRGYPTSAGQPLMLAQSGIQTSTAPTVRRILDSGALLAGKTITDELAFSIIGDNAHFGSPLNPASANRFTGGSSSGSAAVVAAGLVDFSVGTDTGGSVRVPASNCGLFGIRPSHGRVSLEGCIDLAPSFDTCGWFARDVDTFVRVSAVLLGNDDTILPSRLRLIEPADVWSQQGSHVLEAMFAPREKVREFFEAHESTNVAPASFDLMVAKFRIIQGFEAWKVHGQFIEEHSPVLGPGVAERFAFARQVTKEDYAAALNFKADFYRQIGEVLRNDGVMVYPTVSQPAPLRTMPLSTLDSYRADVLRSLCVAVLAGLPQITLPLAETQDAHLGLSLVGPRGSDYSLALLAKQIMSAFGR